MKKALVWKENYNGRNAGQIERIGEASEIDSWTHHLKEKMAIVEVPVELEAIDAFDLDASWVNDKWIKEGEPDEAVDPQDETYTFVPAHYELSKNIAKDKAKRIAEKYNLMNADVLAQMATVFGTTNPESASAYNETWKKMVESPTSYSSVGLTARFAVAGLAVGDALDTDQKVSDYATAKLAEVDAYGVARVVRIEQFRSEKAIIEAE